MSRFLFSGGGAAASSVPVAPTAPAASLSAAAPDALQGSACAPRSHLGKDLQLESENPAATNLNMNPNPQQQSRVDQYKLRKIRQNNWLTNQWDTSRKRRAAENYGVWPKRADGKPHNVVAIGDLHCGFLRFKYILSDLGLYNFNEKRWTGDDRIVVLLGDVVDGKRGDSMITSDCEQQFFELIAEIQQSIVKQKAGGALIRCLGNHEMWAFMQNVNPYASDAELLNFMFDYEKIDGYLENHPDVYHATQTLRFHESMPGGSRAAAFAYQTYAAVLIDGVLYAHAGVCDELRKKTHAFFEKKNPQKFGASFVEAINRIIHDVLLYGFQVLEPAQIALIQHVLNTSYGLFWARPETNTFSGLSTYGIKTQVVGHTITKSNMIEVMLDDSGNRCLFLTDVGLSPIMQNNPKKQAKYYVCLLVTSFNLNEWVQIYRNWISRDQASEIKTKLVGNYKETPTGHLFEVTSE